MTLRRKRIVLIGSLAVLFLVAGTFEARDAWANTQYLLNGKAWLPETLRSRPSGEIYRVEGSAADAGLDTGDRITRVNGAVYRGESTLKRAIAQTAPGGPITLEVRKAAGETQAVTLSTTHARSASFSSVWWLQLVSGVLLPIFCFLLGFTVCFIRFYDYRAWLFLWMMVGFARFFHPGITEIVAWEDWIRAPGLVYDAFLSGTAPLAMMLFGVLFPTPLDLVRRMPWLPWVWIAPVASISLFWAVLVVGRSESHLSVAEFLAPFSKYTEAPYFWLTFSAIGIFFASIGYKYGTAKTPDAKRRLKLMNIGTHIGMAPMFAQVIAAIVTGTRPDAYPLGYGVQSLLILSLFPVTMAYVVVVHRALDLRLVIRQGLRYALSKNALVVVIFLLTIGVLLAAGLMASDPDMRRTNRITILGLAVISVFVIRRIAGTLRSWLDRRFFREAYDAEKILGDLSESVRSMVESGPLIRTVLDQVSSALHVTRAAALLPKGALYEPMGAVGYATPLEVSFASDSATTEKLVESGSAVRVYHNDPTSWVNSNPKAQADKAGLVALDAELLLPMSLKDRLLGFLALGPKKSEEPYTGSDIRLLSSVAAQTGLALENGRLTREVARREVLHREVEIAREVQQRLFPHELPEIPGLDFAGHCRPARGVGGDYYDFLELPERRLGIAIGDISGKGIPASLMMAALQASLRGLASTGVDDLAGLMGRLNASTYQTSTSSRYATFFFAVYSPDEHNLTYVNGGHNPPMLLRASNRSNAVELLEEGGPVIGLLPVASYTQGSVSFESGDTLVAFTDGISEAMNPSEEEWGEERLKQTVLENRGSSAKGLIDRLITEADAFASGEDQHDDMTAVVVRAV